MIIGHGMLAQALKVIDTEHVVFFASGVSNSGEKRKEVFLRESLLLRKVIESFPDKILVYFSSCSVYEHTLTDYSQHKLEMESIIQESCKCYSIFRLPQVVGFGGNPNTLLNFLVNKVRKNESFDVWKNAKRNFIDIDDVVYIVESILFSGKAGGGVMNIASPYDFYVIEVISIIESFFDKKAKVSLVDRGKEYVFDIKEMKKNINMKSIFSSERESYLLNMLMKYYQ